MKFVSSDTRRLSALEKDIDGSLYPSVGPCKDVIKCVFTNELFSKERSQGILRLFVSVYGEVLNDSSEELLVGGKNRLNMWTVC